ncbi:protein tyrosine phosphatase family protein [Planktothrix sp. FACHB-1355]|uniref:Protein tyrosine phosphatase family protein n=1 Tax=Aerosakkonema funiforme FACHB-1375 TaxID=2949571 RepID=A0A926VEE3_9CYAN|nr:MULTISPECIES: protein tyrosine phosphatase family protein [Oscillatoriales]MBD2182070.1 protein tyrosine phosphatase family protein [Aerosakkonema funiforme FACHB-1375]MBD3562158.1 protein tyrosine phosphatase family protein [Planktothrix sp. FACHB-1355]
MSENQIESIYNFFKVSAKVATAGQPTEAQLGVIKDAGYQLIVNLALPESPKALPNEQALVENLGMEYVHIPVVWENPTLEDISQFFSVMEANANKSVFVHCAANMRVSSFIYLYRLLHQGVDEETAKNDLHRIWVPNQKWQAFIEQVIDRYQR